MDTKQITKQLMEFNKTAFDNTFHAMTIIQDQTENIIFRFLEKAQWVPADGKNLMNEWGKAYKKNREYFKAYTDENYKKITDYLIKTENESAQKAGK